MKTEQVCLPLYKKKKKPAYFETNVKATRQFEFPELGK
jgi:hypothetical protein